MTDANILLQLLEQLQFQNAHSPEDVDEITLRVSSYAPKTFQCNVRLRDRTLAWGTFVSEDPAEALSKALYIASRGEGARNTESKCIFYPSREKAQNFADLLLEEYPDEIAAIRTEFEPYKGWVVVVFPRPPHSLNELKPGVEVRAVVEWGPDPSASRTSPRVKTPSSVGKPVTPVDPTTAPAGRAAQLKPVLEQEYRSLTGKAADRNIKRLDLAKILDDMEAAQGQNPTPEPSEDLEEENWM